MQFTMGNCITLEDTNGNRKLLKKRRDAKIDSALDAAREAVKGDDKARIEETSNALTEAAQKLGEKVYAEAQAAAAGAAGAAGAAAGASSAESAHSTETAGDDVVDADFKEVKRD